MNTEVQNEAQHMPSVALNRSCSWVAGTVPSDSVGTAMTIFIYRRSLMAAFRPRTATVPADLAPGLQSVPGVFNTRPHAPFVYRLGLKIFILARGVRLP
jgi:hypothetical protein